MKYDDKLYINQSINVTHLPSGFPTAGNLAIAYRSVGVGTVATNVPFVVLPKQMSLFIPEPDRYKVSIALSLTVEPEEYAKLRTSVRNELAMLMGDKPFMATYELSRELTAKFGIPVMVVDNTEDGLKLDE